MNKSASVKINFEKFFYKDMLKKHKRLSALDFDKNLKTSFNIMGRTTERRRFFRKFSANTTLSFYLMMLLKVFFYK